MRGVKALAILNTGIFPNPVLFSCGHTYEELLKILARKKQKYWIQGLMQVDLGAVLSTVLAYAVAELVVDEKSNKRQTMYYILVRDPFKFTDIEYVTLAHEVLHICQFYLPELLDRGKESEAEAYLHSHLMEQCLKALRGK